MNKHFFRVVFNQARGLLMVVAEIATSHSAVSSATSGVSAVSRLTGKLTPLRFAMLLAAGAVMPAQAAIVADGSAPGGQQPTIIGSANGTPQVNIQTPSAGGVSHNKYAQFDVDQRGVILNNSHNNTASQLGGMVAANPWLAKGEAKIILNEVNSRDPSKLNGFVEVAGRKADVIIANPSGITCNGCGFINAGRATLTTGQPQLSNGNLTGFVVNGGEVAIEGKGLDGSRSDYTDIIARSVKVNAGIWANELTVTTGRNQVDASNTSATAQADNGTVKPQLALDVASLGGMYAGKIRLIGTEQGVGVRNAGQLGSQAGSVVITADGRIENSGSISSSQDVQIAAREVQNSGSVNSAQHLTVQTGQLNSSKDSVLAAGVNRDGTLGSSGNLTVSASGKITAQGKNLAGGTLTMNGQGVDLSGSRTAATAVAVNAGNQTLSTAGAQVDALQELALTTSSTLNNDGGKLSAGKLSLKAQDFSSVGGELSQYGNDDLRFDFAGTFNNQRGKIATGGNLALNATLLNNQQGTLIGGGNATFTTGTTLNQGGLLVGQQSLSLQGDTLENDNGGLLQSGGNLTLNVATLSNNNSGKDGGLIAQQDLLINSGSFSNQSGVALAGQTLSYKGLGFDNRNGQLVAQGALALDVFNGINNQRGLLQGSGVQVNSHGQTVDNQSGTIFSQAGLQLSSGALSNLAGTIGAKGDLTLSNASLDNQQGGRVIGEGNTAITSGSVDNRSGQIQSAGNLLIDSVTGLINNASGLIRSGADAVLLAASLDNSNSQGSDQGIEAQSLSVTADQLTNRQGSLLTGSGLSLNLRDALDNSQGEIASGKTAAIQGAALNLINSAGVVKAGESLTLSGTQIGGDGQLLSLGDLSLTSQNGFTNGGELIANGNLNLTTPGDISNSGKLLAGGNLNASALNLLNSAAGEINASVNRLNITNTLTNYGLIDGGETLLSANTLNNIGSGRIYGDHIAINSATFNNLAENGSAATVAGRQRVDIGTGVLNNAEHSLIYSDGSMAIGGALDENGHATGSADTINNHSATIESAGDMLLNARQINNVNDHFSTEIVKVGEEAIKEYGYKTRRYDFDDPDVFTYHEEVDIICIKNVVCDTDNGDNWYLYNYTRTTQETQVAESDPGKIIAGGNLTINVGNELYNDKSQVVAGGALNIIGGTVANVEVAGERIITDLGTVVHNYRIRQDGKDKQGRSSSDYAPPAVVQSITLVPGKLTDHTQGEGSNIRIDPLQQQGTSTAIGPVGNVSGAGGGSNLKPGQQYEVALPSQGDLVVRISGPDTRIPDNSLFKTNPAANGQYLVETDPRFTNNKQWLGSDYMMQQIASDPNKVQKRLGDGFYEQKLVREQIISATGQRYLAGFSNDEEQYKALMNNGIDFAKKYNLTVGVALTPAQMALLTSDMVWLVSQNVTLPDGSVQAVLVPQVYARVKAGDLDGSGALLAGKSVGLNLSGDLLNKGTIAATDRLQVSAQNITNQLGTLQGADVALTARTDINNLGGRLQAANSLLASAGRDLNLITATRSADSSAGASQFSRTTLDSVAGVYVQGTDGKLVLQAGRDMTLTAAQVSNAGENGQTVLSAGRDLTLNTVTTGSRDDLVFGKNDWNKQSSSQQVGSEVSGNGSVTLVAGHNASLTAATVSAGDALRVAAGNDLTITHGTDSQDVDQYQKITSSGFLSKTTTETRLQSHSEQVNGSMLSGDSVQLAAGNNLTVTGSNVAGTGDVALSAGNNLTIEDAVTTQRDFQSKSETKSGLSGTGGIGVSYGTQSLKTTDEGVSRTSSGSTVGSSSGSLTLSAGNQLTVKGSDLIAQQDMALSGKDVAILAAQEQSSQTHTVEQKTSGLTLALSGAAGSAVNTAVEQSRAAHEQSDSRLAALQATKAALTGYQASQALRMDQAKGAADDSNNDTVGISLSYGSQSSKSTQQSEQSTSKGSSLTAGNNLSIVAHGSGAKGSDGDITLQGSQLKAGQDVLLSANRDVNLVSGENTSSLTGKNESRGGSVGVGIGAGSGGWGINVNASVNGSKGSEKGNGTTYSETTVDAGRQVSIVSGRDTTLTGAQVSANKIVADVGRDLTMTSQQDSDKYDSKQQSASAGGSFTFGSMTASGNVNVSQDKMHSNYQSVQEQTGMFAGSGGFDVTVGNHTQLNGAVIGSTAAAEKNKLDTGTIGFSDIHNQADFSTEHQGMGLSTGGSIGSNFLGNLANTVLAGANNTGHDEGTTKAAVSDGTIIVRDQTNQQQDVGDLSRDVAGANGSIGTIFDKEKEQSRLQQAQLIGEIGSQAINISDMEGAIAGEQAKHNPEKLQQAEAELIAKGNKNPTTKEIEDKAYNTAMAQWGTGSPIHQAITGLTAALQGLAGGNITQALVGASAPYLAEAIHNATTDPVTGKVDAQANLMAHAMLGAVTAAASGNNALAGASAAVMGEYIAQQMYPNIKREDLKEEQRKTISALGTIAAALAGGLVGDSSADAMSGALIGKNAVENNNLTLIVQGTKVAIDVCAKAAPCRNALIERGLGALIGVSVAKTAMDNLSSSDQQHVVLVAMTGKADLIEKLSPQERAAYDELIAGQKGSILDFPMPDRELSPSKLENPAQDGSLGTSLTTPDQREQSGASHTGNGEGVPDTGGNSTVTPIPDGPNMDDLAYLAKGDKPANLSPEGSARAGAFNEAKRRSGIPVSQSPSNVYPNRDKRDNPQPGFIYEFDVPAPGGGTQKVYIRDDAGGHFYGDDSSQNRGPHFNDEKGNHYDY